MDRIWAPWRMEFLAAEKPPGCFLCRYLADDPSRDRTNLVLERGEGASVVMNRYPYSSGHLLIAPHRHTGRLGEIDDRTAAEVWRLADRWTVRIEERMKAEGFNIGFNLGAVAGAGVPGHLHLHLVPRWAGDTNFMPVLGETRVMPQALDECYGVLRD